MKIPWTDRRPTLTMLRVYEAFYEFARNHGFQPSIRELADMCGYDSANAVHGHMQRIARRGYVRFTGLNRAVVLLKKPDGSPFRGFAEK
jgi:SOS-response transcriptional repressor LexA